MMLSQLQLWARELGFSQIAVAPIDLSSAEEGLTRWLAQNFHGDMHYMARHGLTRARPAELVPGTLSVITARMDYLPSERCQDGWQEIEWQRLQDPSQAVVSLYARGRDYHKVLKQRLEKLAQRLREFYQQEGQTINYRVFTDSAPLLEVELAARSGLAWRGKHSLALSRDAGSLFFLGEILVDVALEPTPEVSAHCGSCQACMQVCPTQAIVSEGVVDARRCISYLTIEYAGIIDEALRPLIGQHLYGCDDCQLICPWNKFAQPSLVPDFAERTPWVQTLAQYLQWTETDFLKHTEGTAIRRIGYAQWLRNVATVAGNSLRVKDGPELRQALSRYVDHENEAVRVHVRWALSQTSSYS
jgi:epoxyqueuosine reductase